MTMNPQMIPAGQFKAQCLGLMEQIQETQQPIVVTKRGVPMVTIIPYKNQATSKHALLLPEIVVESTELPGNFHGDPADRILIATARILEFTLATHDEKILAYSKTNRVHTLKI